MSITLVKTILAGLPKPKYKHQIFPPCHEHIWEILAFRVNLQTTLPKIRHSLLMLSQVEREHLGKVYMYIDPYAQTEALMFDVHVFVRGGGAKPNWKSAGAQFHTQFHQQLAFSKGEKRAWSIKAIVFLCRAVLPLPASLPHTKTHPFPLNAQTAEWANETACTRLLQPRANWWCMMHATPSVSPGVDCCQKYKWATPAAPL
jgi:hypothetical protein